MSQHLCSSGFVRLSAASTGLSLHAIPDCAYASGLVLLDLNPASLTLVSVFGLVDCLALVLFGGAVGAYVDR